MMHRVAEAVTMVAARHYDDAYNEALDVVIRHDGDLRDARGDLRRLEYDYADLGSSVDVCYGDEKRELLELIATYGTLHACATTEAQRLHVMRDVAYRSAGITTWEVEMWWAGAFNTDDEEVRFDFG
jgi:hypothetical protein